MDNAANSLHLRDASFSAYLSTAEENFAVKLAESIQSPYLPLLQRKRLPIQPGTPSASSEASWNSHAALLPRLLRNPSPSKQRKANAKMIFAGFGCNGSCSDKKSVYVDTNAEPGGVHGKEIRKKVAQNDPNPLMLDRTRLSQPGFPVKNEIHSRSFDKASIGFKREEYSGYPIINSGLESLTVKGESVDREQKRRAKVPRGVWLPYAEKGRCCNQPREETLCAHLGCHSKVQTVPTTSEGTGMYEDNESDASSDLFEIENLSGSAHPLFNRQASDGMSSCTRYEPSEASIEWSVVTASAADSQ
ncbi:Protein phytochrome kinase substrate 1 [Vitis vinifera]|uniref:Protein phytochrome kinase substrate 1 n=1 Tax=Vitis vinifera TaxID=29760 RepID=A0A438I179_VITVI|nr:Protein phytochrome kinase substrate 1 [Vitis vinifera]